MSVFRITTGKVSGKAGVPYQTKRRKRTLQARLERVFDKLWNKADAVIKEFNPCEVIGKRVVTCLGCRMVLREFNFFGQAIQLPPDGNENTLCCDGCKWHTDKGCVAHQPLTCRTWLCGTAKHKHPEANRRLRRIANRLIQLGFYAHRGDRKASIKNALIHFKAY